MRTEYLTEEPDKELLKQKLHNELELKRHFIFDCYGLPDSIHDLCSSRIYQTRRKGQSINYPNKCKEMPWPIN